MVKRNTLFLLSMSLAGEHGCIFFLQEKSKAFHVFKSFKALVENEIGRTIKNFRTDHGGEYCSKEFEDFLC